MGGVKFFFFLIGTENENWGKKEREKGNYCGEKTMANIWVFYS